MTRFNVSLRNRSKRKATGPLSMTTPTASVSVFTEFSCCPRILTLRKNFSIVRSTYSSNTSRRAPGTTIKKQSSFNGSVVSALQTKLTVITCGPGKCTVSDAMIVTTITVLSLEA